MKSNFLFIFLSITLVSCSTKISLTPEPSAQWMPIGENIDGNIISIDTGNLFRVQDKSKVWVRVDYTVDYKKAKSPKENAIQFYASFNCSDRTFQTIREVHLGVMGESLKDQPINMQPEQIKPLSTEGKVYRDICWNKSASTLQEEDSR